MGGQGVKNRAVMLFCFSSSFAFLRNLQPPLNGNGKFGKWSGGEEGGLFFFLLQLASA